MALKYDIPFFDMNRVFNKNEEYFFKNPLDGVHFSIKGENYFGLQLYFFIKDYL